MGCCPCVRVFSGWQHSTLKSLKGCQGYNRRAFVPVIIRNFSDQAVFQQIRRVWHGIVPKSQIIAYSGGDVSQASSYDDGGNGSAPQTLEHHLGSNAMLWATVACRSEVVCSRSLTVS